MHNLLLPVDTLCPCLHSTRPSWALTNLPSNWRSRHRNRMAPRKSRIRLPGLGSLSHGPCNTTPSWPQTNPPASSRIHPDNCMGRLGAVALSADHRCGGDRSTKSAWQSPRTCTPRRRNCMGPLVQALLWAGSGPESPVAWPAAWAAVWEREWAALSLWFPAKLSSHNRDPLWRSSNLSGPETTSSRCFPSRLRSHKAETSRTTTNTAEGSTIGDSHPSR